MKKEKKRGIFSRIFGAIILVSFIAVTLVSFLTLRDKVNIFHDSVIREKTTLLDTIHAYSLQEDSFSNSKEILKKVEKSGDVIFLWIVDEEGNIFYSGQEDLVGKNIEDPFVGVDVFRKRSAKYQGREVEVLARPVEGPNDKSWTVMMGVIRVSALAFFFPAFFRAVFILMGALLLSTFLALILTEKIIEPLLQLKRAIIKTRKGDLNQRINIKTNDEIEEIGEEFNDMSQKLKIRKNKLEEARQILKIKVKARTKELKELANNLEDKVGARTEELQRKVEELEKFHKLTVGREKKMIELKEKNENLKKKIEEIKE